MSLYPLGISEIRLFFTFHFKVMEVEEEGDVLARIFGEGGREYLFWGGCLFTLLVTVLDEVMSCSEDSDLDITG